QRIIQLEQQVATLTRLLEVNQTMNAELLSTTPDGDALLSYIMNAAASITDSEAASILLWNKNTRQLYFAATTTESSQALIGKPVPLDSIAGSIFTQKRAQRVDNVEQDPRHYDQVDHEINFVTRSLFGVPLIAKQHAIGVLEVVNKRGAVGTTWSEQDLAYLPLLADEAAVAIEVAELVLQLQKANQEMSELDKLKSDFIAIASHELRTPLGIILGYASFLQDEATDPEYGELAAKVTNSALQLRRIIEDMLNLRYLKQSEAELNREQLPFYELLVDLEADALNLTEANHHTLTVDYPPKTLQLYIDRARISMALNNLMNNAVRFTPSGGTLHVSCQIQSNTEAWIIIRDSGIGIAPEHLEKVFEEFYQVEDHMTRQHGGLGIGLSIAQALVSAHGGRVWAESAGVGQGATFTIALPLAE
ncbi:MAG: HAMP domain-containing histidine kinase, partial [Armatimonadetes bacterium]|nr:HAMP domain-containing histidine kinase [Anaerolineae bacterium]